MEHRLRVGVVHRVVPKVLFVHVREVVAATPMEQILLETDAPYLTPVPYRGRPNAPFYLPFIAERVAEVKAIPVETLLEQAYRNSRELFFSV